MFQLTFNWKVGLAIAGIMVWNFYCRLYPGTTKSLRIINFLRRLERHPDRRLLIIWEGRAAHRRRRVVAYVESTQGAHPPRPSPQMRRNSTP